MYKEKGIQGMGRKNKCVFTRKEGNCRESEKEGIRKDAVSLREDLAAPY